MATIGKWKGSYYCNSKKSWVYGIFAVCPQFVRFYEVETPNSSDIDLKVYFDEFIELKKESTGIFYSALTIRCSDNKYWFGSFPSCTHVYNILEHFWRERLLSSKISAQQHEFSCGQKLLNILHESADCLSSTSKTLERQGQQIDNACRTMNQLHNDLGVAEAIIHSMDSWLNRWDLHLPEVVIELSKDNDKLEKTEFPILYASHEKEKHISGSLVLGSKTLEILDIKRNPLYSFTAREVSEGRVHTPFEMTLFKSEIGKPEVCVHLISAKLVKVIPLLNVILGPKLSFDEPPEGIVMATAVSHDDSDEFLSNLKLDEMEKKKKKKMQSASSSISSRKETKTVSETEAAQMAKVLQNMKSMAVGIQDEQNRQLVMLDSLSDSVDKANERIRTNSRTVNRLT